MRQFLPDFYEFCSFLTHLSSVFMSNKAETALFGVTTVVKADNLGSIDFGPQEIFPLKISLELYVLEDWLQPSKKKIGNLIR